MTTSGTILTKLNKEKMTRKEILELKTGDKFVIVLEDLKAYQQMYGDDIKQEETFVTVRSIDKPDETDETWLFAVRNGVDLNDKEKVEYESIEIAMDLKHMKENGTGTDIYSDLKFHLKKA